MMPLMPSTMAEMWARFALAASLTTLACVPIAYALLRITGVPSTYPPLLPLQVVSGTIGGALLVTLGYAFLAAVVPNTQTRTAIFLWAGIVLLVVSFYLPYRLTYTQSPRFAGVTLGAQIGQGLLHTLVVVLSMICFLRK